MSGELGLRSLGRLADDEVTRKLTTVWGIGEWTTQMFLIFKLGRADVMPGGVHFGASPRGFSGVSRTSNDATACDLLTARVSEATRGRWTTDTLELMAAVGAHGVRC